MNGGNFLFYFAFCFRDIVALVQFKEALEFTRSVSSTLPQMIGNSQDSSLYVRGTASHPEILSVQVMQL